MDELLSARGLSLKYGSVSALRDVSMCLHAGEMVAILGPSGSGKSSLLHCLAGIIRPDSGEITVSGRSLVNMGDDELAELRRTILGLVFQFGELVPELTLLENVSLPLRFQGVRRKDALKTSRTVMAALGLDGLEDRRPGAVSGGQMQRAALARGLAHGPSIVFADEPTGALDSAAGDQVLALAREQVVARGTTFVLVTHDAKVAASADRVLTMRDGRLTSDFDG